MCFKTSILANNVIDKQIKANRLTDLALHKNFCFGVICRHYNNNYNTTVHQIESNQFVTVFYILELDSSFKSRWTKKSFYQQIFLSVRLDMICKYMIFLYI